ncbi:MAG: NADPH-dependent oxidoreductase [Verrucomicrobia bacterium]|nr:MAG: NADPH-dependent oxidoreductase [Verrucomicrobiota bacterium]
MKRPKILAFGGSLRAASFNQKLATIAADHARVAGADVTLISLRDFPLPLFDEDLEAAHGMPVEAVRLKACFADHDGLIIASPEYNSTISAALKNAIDWVSRATEPNEPPLSVLKGKNAAIMAASPGSYGGSRGLIQLRLFLVNIGISVLPEQVTVAKAHEAFDAGGGLLDASLDQKIAEVMQDLVKSL